MITVKVPSSSSSSSSSKSSSSSSKKSAPAPAALGGSGVVWGANGLVEGKQYYVSELSLDDKFALARSVGEECIQEAELRLLLEKKPHPIVYDGFEPSGRMHIAQGVMRAINVNKLTKCGCVFKVMNGWDDKKEEDLRSCVCGSDTNVYVCLDHLCE